MDFFKLPKSDISQEYKILSSSTNEIHARINYDFSNDMKEMWNVISIIGNFDNSCFLRYYFYMTMALK